MTKSNIAYLPLARRTCECGNVRAVADACARRDPRYRKIAVMDCADCGCKIENPFTDEALFDPQAGTGGFVDYRPEDAPDPDPEPPPDMSFYRPRGLRKTRFTNSPEQVCAECGSHERKGLPLFYVEFRDEEGSFWEWWCASCHASLDISLP